MKPIIADMKDMSDSTEVYGTRPSPVFAGVIYALLGILIIAGIWMYFFKIDIVTHSEGMIRCSEDTATITNITAGKIVDMVMEDGTYVKKGDKLFSIDATLLDQQKENCIQELDTVKERVDILNAYLKVLDGENDALDDYKDNVYYEEFVTRKTAVQINCDSLHSDTSTKQSQYQNSMNSIQNSIDTAQAEQNKLTQMLTDIKNRSNDFSVDDVYYHTAVDDYINNYNLTASGYESQIKQLQETRDTGDTSVNYDDKIADLNTEKSQALSKVESEMLASVEQSLNSVNENLDSLSASKDEAQNNLDNLNNGSEELSKEQVIVNEKNSVYAELNTYQNKESEYETSIDTLQSNINDCDITAQCNGYLNLTDEPAAGDYLSAGETIGSIVPKEDGFYTVEIYVDNQDIGKIKKGQLIKYEVAAYPSSEYGKIEGTVTKISKDIKVNKDTGTGYYEIEASIRCSENSTKGKEVEFMQGMAVEAKLITDQKSIMRFLLEKINLLDT